MDSTSTAGDTTSEELHRVTTIAPSTQAMDPSSQFVQSEGSKEDVQTRDPSKLDVAPNPPKTASVGTQVGTTEHEQVSTNDFRDDVSIDSLEIDDMRQFQRAQHRYPAGAEVFASRHKKDGKKFLKVAAFYTEILETRVASIEKELLELQYEVGFKERRNERGYVM